MTFEYSHIFTIIHIPISLVYNGKLHWDSNFQMSEPRGLLQAGISWNQITYLKLIKAVVASGQAWRQHVSCPEDFNGNPWRRKFHKESNGF